MTASRTRATKLGPGFTQVTCDFRQRNGDGCPDSAPGGRGESASLVRRYLREVGWVRVEGKDFCPAHVCPHGYVPGDHHYDAGTCGPCPHGARPGEDHYDRGWCASARRGAQSDD